MISSWLAQLKAEENTEAESKQSWLEKLGTNSKVKEEEEKEGGWRGWNTLLAMRLSAVWSTVGGNLIKRITLRKISALMSSDQLFIFQSETRLLCFYAVTREHSSSSIG